MSEWVERCREAKAHAHTLGHGVCLVQPPEVRGQCPACRSRRWGQGLTYRRCLDCRYQEGESVAEILRRKG
jgi:hypothetical protein